MEAPKKIYVHVKRNKVTNTWNSTFIGVNDIEYVRKDAFIDKVKMWFNSENGIVITDTKAFLGAFINYMEIE